MTKKAKSSLKGATTDNPYIIQPTIKDPAERAAMLKEIVKSMRSNPIPADAPHLTREELHARR